MAFWIYIHGCQPYPRNSIYLPTYVLNQLKNDSQGQPLYFCSYDASCRKIVLSQDQQILCCIQTITILVAEGVSNRMNVQLPHLVVTLYTLYILVLDNFDKRKDKVKGKHTVEPYECCTIMILCSKMAWMSLYMQCNI